MEGMRSHWQDDESTSHLRKGKSTDWYDVPDPRPNPEEMLIARQDLLDAVEPEDPPHELPALSINASTHSKLEQDQRPGDGNGKESGDLEGRLPSESSERASLKGEKGERDWWGKTGRGSSRNSSFPDSHGKHGRQREKF